MRGAVGEVSDALPASASRHRSHGASVPSNTTLVHVEQTQKKQNNDGGQLSDKPKPLLGNSGDGEISAVVVAVIPGRICVTKTNASIGPPGIQTSASRGRREAGPVLCHAQKRARIHPVQAEGYRHE